MGLSTSESYSYNARDVIFIEIVHNDKTRKPDIFHPVYTYPIFGEEEKIKGYKDIIINLKFSCHDLQIYLKIQYTDKVNEKKKMSCENVEELFQVFLPKSTFLFFYIFDSHLNDIHLFVPPGDKISSYEVNDSVFEIFMSSIIDPNVKKIIDNLQIFSLFFIEGASYIDIEDFKWNIFLLYEKRRLVNSSGYYHFIGYSTVYSYYWYSRESFDNIRTRIAQFIILPPFQKQGHGGKFYDALYIYFLSDPKVQEITVEDPSEEFEYLRDKQDIIRLKSYGIFDSKEFKAPIQYSWILETQKKYKISLNQFFRCMEIILLERLNMKNEKDYKDYRLQVKQRIYKKNFENLNQYNKGEILRKLEETYKSIENDYFRVLKSMKVHRYEQNDSELENKKIYV
ncbi:histone acetyltransferase catalytic subunit HAT1 [Pneumocystis jirovecii RU7]|uniref:Histone acetyltransferase type B catalytic subunit n=1 Tax=Pneumocystis jirovecii (strain RU7) TaxID=1408657 RepID=A0A0W4ZRD0_PNEJ7|nr:histone acetyltransferase catalytic subunit HAT1 [Pneumocystis jirovecii RU7]KTW30933.1 hypothetical protein T551_01485 [Pneumocystis jirovecii RU7]